MSLLDRANAQLKKQIKPAEPVAELNLTPEQTFIVTAEGGKVFQPGEKLPTHGPSLASQAQEKTLPWKDLTPEISKR